VIQSHRVTSAVAETITEGHQLGRSSYSHQFNRRIKYGNTQEGHCSSQRRWVAVVAFGQEIARTDIEKETAEKCQHQTKDAFR
jgi:hypothetical protein